MEVKLKKARIVLRHFRGFRTMQRLQENTSRVDPGRCDVWFGKKRAGGCGRGRLRPPFYVGAAGGPFRWESMKSLADFMVSVSIPPSGGSMPSRSTSDLTNSFCLSLA